MSSVLIVDDDVRLREALAREVRAWGFEVFVEDSAEAALSRLRSQAVDVLVTDLRMGGLDGIDLIRAARAHAPETQTLLMSAFATARDHQLATEHGTIRVLCKPFTPAQLREALREALDSRDSFRGTVHGLSLLDMLQLFHLSRRSVTLTISGSPRGYVHFQSGDLVHARCGALVDRDALIHLLQSRSGSVFTSPLDPAVPRTIDAPFDGMLVNLLRQIDEGGRTGEPAVGTAPPFPSAATAADPAAAAGDPWTAELFDNTALSDSSESESMPPPKGERPSEESDAGGPLTWNEAVPDSQPESETRPPKHLETNMSDIDKACQKVVQETDGGVACGVVDLDTGMLLGVFNNAGYSQSLNEIVAAACMDMFRGTNVNRVHQAVRAHRGMPEDGEHYFEEIHITSKNNYHFMKTIRAGKAVMVLVTGKNTNVGMGWAVLKSMVSVVEPLVP